MAGSVFGNRVLRKEDPKFLTTGGVYVDDLKDPALDGEQADRIGLVNELILIVIDQPPQPAAKGLLGQVRKQFDEPGQNPSAVLGQIG